MLWVDSESLWVPRPAPLTNTLPAPTGETVSRLIKPTPSTGDTWPEGFPSKRKTMSPAWPRKVLQAFLFVPKSSNSVSPAPSHTPEPGCSVPGSEQEERGQRAPPPHPLPPPHTCTRWAGPRADPQSLLGRATYFSYSVLSLSQRESLCFCQSLPCLQVVRSTTSSPLWT